MNNRFSFKNRIIFSLPAIFIAVVIFWISHTPHPEFPKIGIVWEDKIAHVIAYFLFGLSLILFFLANIRKFDYRFIVIITMIFGTIYGCSDELHQYFIPGRDAEILDWIADMVGISLSLLLINNLKTILEKRYA